MALMVKRETANKLQDLIDRKGRSSISESFVPRDLGGPGAFQYSRFRLDYTDELTVTIKKGKWSTTTKNDTDITGAGNDNAGFAASFAASTKFYVWLVASNLYITCGTTLPTAPPALKVFGEFETDSDSKVQESTVIRYWIGDGDWLRAY